MSAVDSRALASRRTAYAVVAAAAILPRLAVLLYERGTITAANVDKGDDLARTFLATGTYGFIPGHPSAYTQPLYGFFLVPLYWIFDRSWLTVGVAQIVVATATALLVYELGRRVMSARVGLLAALVVTLEPYVVWHDVHMNREILDELLAVAVVLLTLVLADRPTPVVGAAVGAVAGLAILGNVRLLALPVVLAAFAVGCAGRAAVVPSLAVLLAALVVLLPWTIRNRASVGCFTITTDARALWKANNPATLRTLENGGWIDDVPGISGAPPTPQDAGAIYERTGRVVATNECAQMRFYRHRALSFMVDHPGEKARLALVAARMLWQPSVTRTEGRRGRGTLLDTGRTWLEGAYAIALYALAIAGAFLLPRRLVVLAALLLAYTTLTAMVFAGETRYRVPWDFLLAISASAAVVELTTRLESARRGPALARK
jgi:hypothetical protein